MKCLPAVIVAVALAPLAAAQPLSSAFTFQGRLTNGTTPATGAHDLRFHLFDASSGGTEISPPLCADNVPLADGSFTVQLDFGSSFRGDQTFLEVEVRPDTGLSCAVATGFTTLSPRQQVTAAPNALFALNAAAAATAESATTAATASNATQLNGQAAPFYLNAANLSSGILPGARLAGTYAGALTLSSPSNILFGSGLNLTALNATNVASGILPDARLSANIPRLNGTSAFTGIVNMSNGSNTFTGTGAGLTGLNAANLTTGLLPDARLASNIARLDGGNDWIGSNFFQDSGNEYTGIGTNITGLNASNIASGLLSPARGGTGTSVTTATTGQVLKWNGLAFTPQADADTLFSAGSGLLLTGATFSIPTGGVTGPMILDGTIAANDLATGAVTGTKIAASAVTGSAILDNTITAADIAPSAVASSELASDAASLIKVSGGAIGFNGDGSVGILGPGTVFDSALTVNGAITATRVDLNLSRTLYFSIPPVAFVGWGLDFLGNSLPASLSNNGIATNYANAPVYLPNSAQITVLVAQITDDDSNENVVVRLYRQPNNGDIRVTLATLSSTGTGSSARRFSTSVVGAVLADTQNNSYYVSVEIPASTHAMLLHSVTVQHNITSLP